MGKAALITGGATGLGRSCALKLAALGMDVAVVYSRSSEDAFRTAAEIEATGRRGIALRADVAGDGQVRAMVGQVLAELGRVDVLINCAGRTHYVDLADLDAVQESQWDDIFDTNVKGAFFVTRACAAELRRNRGCVINISSNAAFVGRGSSIPYAVSKAALINLTRCLARALAPEVRVNSVAPGIMNTRWVEGRREHVERQARETLLGKIAEPDDVAEAVLGLILHGDFITAQTLVVDGGASI